MSKIMKNLARTLSLFLVFSGNFYKSKIRNIITELCLPHMIYNDKLWQSINETNKESKYLQFCRSKAYCQFRIHCLLEAVCFNFITLQDPRRLLYVHCKSSSSTTEQFYAWNTGYLSKIVLVCFIMGEKCPKHFWP